MPEAVPTVIIVNPDKTDEQLVMNESEYDPKKHVLWEERLTKPAPRPAPPASAASPSGGMRAPGAPFVKDPPTPLKRVQERGQVNLTLLKKGGSKGVSPMSLVIKTANVLAMASGVATTVTASDSVVTGLREVFFAVANIQSDPVLTAAYASAAIPDQVSSPGVITIKTWMPTSSSVTTPIAATTFTKTVSWVAFGK